MTFKKFGKKLAIGFSIIMAVYSVVACGKTVSEPDPVPVDTVVTEPVQTPEPEPADPVEVEPEEPEEEIYVKPEEYFVTVGNVETGDTVEIGSYEYVADIHNIKITDLDAFKEQINQLPNLLYIDMCDCGLTNEQMEDLQYTFPSIRFVWMLHMTNTNSARTLWWKVRTDALAFSTLHAYATDPRLDNDQAQQLKYCEDLVALDFGHNAIHDTSFMKDMDMHILITVDSYNRVEKHKFDSLDVVANFKNLMYLETFVGAITDTECLKDCKELLDLNLSYNPISDITYLKDFPKLERFVIESTKISKADYDILCECYPDITIYYTGSGSVDHGWRGHPRYFAMIDMYRKNYWNDLFRTEAELEEVAARDLIVIDGVRYYGTAATDELIIDEPEIEEADSETDTDGAEDTDAVTESAPVTDITENEASEGENSEDTDAADEAEEADEFVPYTATDKYGNTFSFENVIESTVGANNIPKENNECNFNAVGNVYSTDNGNGKILVLMEDGKYHWFYKNEVIARILIEKLDEDGEIKAEYTREAVEERVAAEREAEAQAAAEEAARLEAEAQAEAADGDDTTDSDTQSAGNQDGSDQSGSDQNDSGNVDDAAPIESDSGTKDEDNN